MNKTIINVSNDFFDVGGKDGDVMYSFTGNNACGIKSKSNSVLYGKTINLSEMYDTMLDSVREFLFGVEFLNSSEYNTSDNRKSMMYTVNKYTTKKYGISIQCVYNKIHGIHGNIRDTTMTVDILFNELKNKYGMTGIDWMYLYNNMKSFRTNDEEILDYIGNMILSNDIHEYFVTEYNLRTVGVVKKTRHCINKNNVSVDKSRKCIKVEWNNGGLKEIPLSEFVRSYKHWWMMVTVHKNKDRCDIRDYDKLLNGRTVTEVFPKYCPVFSNLRMNYTGIDFDGKSNVRKCSEIAGYSDKGETWSAASIDRVDSNKGYSYDNIRIISQYANYLKNVGNIDQMRRLVQYMDEQNSYF